MRQFIVLGCRTNAQTDPGEIILQTADCAKATAEVKAPSNRYARKELHELAVPMIRKQHASEAEAQAEVQAEAEAKKQAEAEAVDGQAELESVQNALKLAEAEITKLKKAAAKTATKKA